jgi:hypothetical protein
LLSPSEKNKTKAHYNMSSSFFYSQYIYQPQDQIVVHTHEQVPLQFDFGISAIPSRKTGTKSDETSLSTGECINDIEFDEQWKQFEQEYQLVEEENESDWLNTNMLSILISANSPNETQDSQAASQTNIATLANCLHDKVSYSDTVTITNRAGQNIGPDPIFKETAIRKKKHRTNRKSNESKALRKWKQWIWIDDQKNELIEVRDIYKKKKKPYDEFCTVLTTTKK